MYLCFENHSAFEIKLDPFVNCSDKRFLTRYSAKSNPLSLVAKIQKSTIKIDQLPKLYLNQTGTLMTNMSRNLLIPWSQLVNKCSDGFFRVWAKSSNKLSDPSKGKYKAWYSLTFTQSRIYQSLSPLVACALYQTEVLRTCMDFLSHFYLLLKGSMKCFVSHVGFLELLAIELGIGYDSPKYKNLCILMSKYDSNNPKFFDSILKKMMGNNHKKINKVKNFLTIHACTIINFKTEIHKFIKSCKKKNQPRMMTLSDCILLELEMMDELLQGNWNYERLTMNYATYYPHDKDFTFHSGFVFSVIYSRTYKKGGGKKKIKNYRHVLAQGGRLDNTLAAYNPALVKSNKKSTTTVMTDFSNIRN